MFATSVGGTSVTSLGGSAAAVSVDDCALAIVLGGSSLDVGLFISPDVRF
jgi:hypothetical protein